MNRKINICYITGTRADYGLMRHTLREMEKHFSLTLAVVGMHLLGEFGSTVKEIENDGFSIGCRIRVALSGQGNDMAVALGRYVVRLTKFFSSNRPDLIVVLGDRGEAIAGAVVGAHLNIPVAHIHGGDQGDDGANIDDLIRHAITKFSHIHLAATAKSAERILKMGEEKWRVHVVGTPALVKINSKKFFSKQYLAEKFKINFSQPLVLVIQHPVSTEWEQAGQQMRITLEALQELNLQTVLVYPNADTGSEQMIKVIKSYEKYSFLQTYKSLPRREYLSLMKYANVMIGNSSSGTIDAAFFRLPVVNVGIRESTREHAGNKIFVGHDKQEIITAIEKALYDKRFITKVRRRKNPYGGGTAHTKIVSVIKRVFPLSERKKQKLLARRLTY